MKNPGEIAVLRTMLRDVNVEYSGLVKAKADAGRLARMGELKQQRRALMTLIAEAGGHQRRERPAVHEPLPPAGLWFQFSRLWSAGGQLQR